MAEEHTHHHHHDYAKTNADHFSEKASSYRSELSTEIAKRCAANILKHYSFDSNQTEALDFACGPGMLAFEILPHAKRIVGADISEGMVDVFNKTVEEQGLSSEKLHCIKIDSLKNDQTDINGLVFDVIFCAQAYHHFEDPIQMTRALANRLKPNGRLFIIDFAAGDDVEKFFGKLHDDKHANTVPHKHGFTFERIIEIFQAAGLQNPHVENAFQMSKSELKSYQGHEVFSKVIDSDLDFTLNYFIAYADK